QDQPRRVRHGLVHREQRFPDHAQSLGPGAHSRRLQRWLGGGRRRPPGAARPRFGHRRVRPPPRPPLPPPPPPTPPPPRLPPFTPPPRGARGLGGSPWGSLRAESDPLAAPVAGFPWLGGWPAAPPRRDSTSAPEPVPPYLANLDRPVQPLTIGIAREHFGAGL